MTDNLIKCPLSGGNACYHTKAENGHESFLSYSVGYATDSTKKLGSKTQEEFEEVLPQLYKDLRWVDPETQLVWYPVSHNEPRYGIVFADGTSTEDWKWSALKARRLTKKEQRSHKFPLHTSFVNDPSSLKSFDRLDFIEALDYIGALVK